ncbi:MAG: hypothetical protein JRH20_02120 [Deltaproteobacteria bacterium]|nr:hypothetical protein [Deltaproteobacteria bacterium]
MPWTQTTTPELSDKATFHRRGDQRLSHIRLTWRLNAHTALIQTRWRTGQLVATAPQQQTTEEDAGN